MKNATKIDIVKSVKLGKLCFSDEVDKFQKLPSYIIIVFSIYLCGSAYFSEKESNKLFILFVVLVPILFLLYSFYRLIVEKKLISVETNLNNEKNRKLILDYAEKNAYRIFRDSDECIILEKDGYITSKVISLVVLIQDRKIYFTNLKEGFKFDSPTLFSHIIIKKELERFSRDFACL